jgi:hypothetical protein
MKKKTDKKYQSKIIRSKRNQPCLARRKSKTQSQKANNNKSENKIKPHAKTNPLPKKITLCVAKTKKARSKKMRKKNKQYEQRKKKLISEGKQSVTCLVPRQHNHQWPPHFFILN